MACVCRTGPVVMSPTALPFDRQDRVHRTTVAMASEQPEQSATECADTGANAAKGRAQPRTRERAAEEPLRGRHLCRLRADLLAAQLPSAGEDRAFAFELLPGICL